MLERRVINLRIGDTLRQVLFQRSSASRLEEPVPGILWGKWDGEQHECYSIGFYERKDLPIDDPIRIVEADGIEFVITQDWICDGLSGRTLDITAGVLTVSD